MPSCKMLTTATMLAVLFSCKTSEWTQRDYELAAQDVRDVATLIGETYPEDKTVQLFVQAAWAFSDRLSLGDLSVVEVLLAMEPGLREYLNREGKMTPEINLAITGARIVLRRFLPPPEQPDGQ